MIAVPFVYSVTLPTVFGEPLIRFQPIRSSFTDFWIAKPTNQTYGRLRTYKYAARKVSFRTTSPQWQLQSH
jgi:hypothetical protein